MAIEVSCKNCQKRFFVKPFFIKIGGGKYCSAKCQHEGKRTGKWFKCDGCGKDVYRTPKYIEASKSKKYFCGKSCQTTWRNKEYSGVRHANWKHGMASYRHIMMRAGKKVQCELCNMVDDRVIIVHHKNKNRMDNSVHNLIWLCRNCHYLVHHYKDRLTAPFIV